MLFFGGSGSLGVQGIEEQNHHGQDHEAQGDQTHQDPDTPDSGFGLLRRAGHVTEVVQHQGGHEALNHHAQAHDQCVHAEEGTFQPQRRR